MNSSSNQDSGDSSTEAASVGPRRRWSGWVLGGGVLGVVVTLLVILAVVWSGAGRSSSNSDSSSKVRARAGGAKGKGEEGGVRARSG